MDNRGKILAVDDNRDVLSALEILLDEEFEKFTAIANPNLILQEIRQDVYDVVLLDMNFSSRVQTGNEGIFWLREILAYDPEIVVILFTAYGDVEIAVKAMKEGALDFVMKPWDNEKLLATLNAAVTLGRSRKESRKLKNIQGVMLEDALRQFPGLKGSSAAYARIREVIDKTAPTDANILISGENGTGKSLVAREIHNKSLRIKEAFITVDLGSIHENLFESELFGYKKGAFTDARNNRTGRIETANGGTLFMDEIGNLSMPMQAKLLSVLQEKKITPLGSNVAVPVDVRLLCATNKNLPAEVANGNFREDLYYRINTIEIEIPPLRKRQEDIEELARLFFDRYTHKYNKPGMRMSQAYIQSLLLHGWPGNVRELEHALEQSVILGHSDVLGAEDFFIKHDKRPTQAGSSSLTLEEIEKEAILNALAKHGGNQVQAARELNITRQTIHNKIKRYGL